MEWLYAWSIDIKKRACCYLIQRYFGKFFEEKLNLDQLSVDLYNGTATVCHVRLDCENLNEIFAQYNLPIELVRGYIKRITISIPWSQLLRESSHFEIEGFHLHVRATDCIDNAFDTGSLMLESMLSSITLMSSQNVTEDYLRREQPSSMPDSKSQIEGIEKLAQTIDSILNRIVVLLKYTEIHFEQSFKNEKNKSLQFNIETINYFDESEVDSDPLNKQRNPKHDVSSKNDSSMLLNNLYSSKRVIIEGVKIFCNIIDSLNNIDSQILIGHITECQEIRLRTKLSDEINDVKFSLDVIFSSFLMYMDPKNFRTFYDILSNFLSRNFQMQNEKSKSKGNISKVKPLTDYDNQMIEKDLQQQMNSSVFMDTFVKRQMHNGWSTAEIETIYDDFGFDTDVEFYPMNSGVKKSNSMTSITDSFISDTTSSTNTSTNTSVSSSFIQKSFNLEETLSSSTFDFNVKFKQIAIVIVEDLVDNETVKDKYMGQNHLKLDVSSLNIKGSQKNMRNSKSMINLLFNISTMELCEYLWNNDLEIFEKIKLLSTVDETTNYNISLRLNHVCKFSNHKPNSSSNTDISIDFKNIFMELDLTILDRISNILNLFCNVFESKDPTIQIIDDLNNKSCVDINMMSPKLKIKFRLPIADFSSFEKIESYSKWFRNIHDDFLLITIDSFVLRTTLNTKHVDSLKIDLLAHNIQIDYLDKHLALLSSTKTADMPYASIPKISIIYNYASAIPVPKQAQSPFNLTKTLYQGQELILPAEQSDIKQFISFAKKNALLSVVIFVPKLFINFESKVIFELLYNRIGSHLSLWETMEQKRRNFQNMFNPIQKKFSRCRSRVIYESDDETEDDCYDNDVNVNDNDDDISNKDKHCNDCNNISSFFIRSGFNKNFLALQINIEQGAMNLSTKFEDYKFDEIRIIANDLTMFLVSEYNGDPNLSLLTFESKTFDLYHSDTNLVIDEKSHIFNLNDYLIINDYLRLILSQSPESLEIFDTKQKRSMLTIVAFIQNMEQNKKNITLSLGFNEILMRYYQNLSKDHYWLIRLIEFFNIVDYPIDGYTSKSCFTNLYFHLWNCCIDYRPISLQTKCLLTISYFVMNSSLASRVKNSVLKFMFDDCALFLSNNNNLDYINYDFEKDYICLVDFNLFELLLSISSSKDNKPIIDLRMISNQINIRTCSDSAALLMELLVYFASDGDLKLDQVAKDNESVDIQYQYRDDNSNKDSGLSSLEQEKLDRISLLLSDAIDEELSSNVNDSNELLDSKSSIFYFPDENRFGTKYPISPRKICIDSNLELDDDFCFLDYHMEEKIFKPKTSVINNINIDIIEEYFSNKSIDFDNAHTSNKNLNAILQYSLSEVSVKWSIFGGNDFKSKNEKTFSSSSTPTTFKENIFASQRRMLVDDYVCKKKSYLEVKQSGGCNRNYNIQMEVIINKLRFQHALFPKSEKKASRQLLVISEFEILDKLASSEINKFLYEYTSSKMPKQTNSNMLKIRAVHVRSDLNSNTTECCLKISLAPLRFNIDQDSVLFLTQFFTDLTKSSEKSDVKNCCTILCKSSPVHRPPVLNVSLETQLNHLIDDNTDETNSEILNFTESNDTDIFFKRVIFSSNVPIKLDYHGKHMDMSMGKMAGILLGLANLNNSEFILKRISHRQGILGIHKLINFIVNQWLIDIRSQLHYILGGFGPIYSIIQLMQGFRDLFMMPIQQYKRDGRIIRGIQKGAFSFSTCTTMAFLELSSRFVNLIQATAETAYDIVSSGPSIRKLKHKKKYKKKHRHPQDIREGCHNAFLLVKEGFSETAQDIVQIAAYEHEQKGYTGAVGGIIRQIPPAIVKPIIIATEATNNVIGGCKCQLVPDVRLEANQKWKKC